MGAWEVFRWALRSWYDEMILFVGVGLVAFVFQLPFAFVAYVAFALPPPLFPIGVPLLIPFLPSPAMAGIYALARELARGEGVSWGLFWSATRRYWARGLALYFIAVVVTMVIRTAVEFYVRDANPIFNGIGYVMLYLLIWWLTMQLFIMPLMLDQERWNPLQIYRQALAVLALKPLLVLGLLVMVIIILLVGAFTVIGMPLIAIPLVVAYSAHAVQFAKYGPPKNL